MGEAPTKLFMDNDSPESQWKLTKSMDQAKWNNIFTRLDFPETNMAPENTPLEI